MELAVQAFRLEGAAQAVDPIGHEERRPLLAFGQEVAQGTVEGAGHVHRDAVPGEEGERAVDAPHGRGVGGADALARLVHRHVLDLVHGGVEQVDHTIEGSVHK